MTELMDTIRAGWITSLVQKTITCPNTGKVLDVRTCVVLNDREGDPYAVLSPEDWDRISNSPATVAFLAQYGISASEK